MTSSKPNADTEHRDCIIFNKPLDWQSKTEKKQRVSFDKLPLSGLEQLIQEGFVATDDRSSCEPDPLHLVQVARCMSQPELSCCFEVLVSPPTWQQFVYVTSIRFEGSVALQDRAAFWQAFEDARSLRMTPNLLQATFDSAVMLFATRVVPYQEVLPWDPPDPEDFLEFPFM